MADIEQPTKLAVCEGVLGQVLHTLFQERIVDPAKEMFTRDRAVNDMLVASNVLKPDPLSDKAYG